MVKKVGLIYVIPFPILDNFPRYCFPSFWVCILLMICELFYPATRKHFRNQWNELLFHEYCAIGKLLGRTSRAVADNIHAGCLSSYTDQHKNHNLQYLNDSNRKSNITLQDSLVEICTQKQEVRKIPRHMCMSLIIPKCKYICQHC